MTIRSQCDRHLREIFALVFRTPPEPRVRFRPGGLCAAHSGGVGDEVGPVAAFDEAIAVEVQHLVYERPSVVPVVNHDGGETGLPRGMPLVSGRS